MIISVTHERIGIRLTALEKILSMHGSLEMMTSDVAGVGTDAPPSTWKEIRAPGTFLPWVVKAGTYYTARGKEFWCLFRGKTPLRIELKNNSYKRVILGVEDSSLAEMTRQAAGL